MTSLVCIAVAYLIGSISFAIVASRIFGLPDPRSYGSGNPGATNVLRSGKKAAALVTLIGDSAKGLLAVVLARALAPVLGHGDGTVACAALAVFLGHLFPIYFGFKGGKGVATAFGVLLGLSPWVALVALIVFIVTVVLSRYASAASLLGCLAASAVSPLLLGFGPYTVAIVVLTALVMWRHRANLRRLVSGTESKLSFGRKQAPPPAASG
jgi:acyl phosphate:glycerol-3-phosphate acyltransferase